VQNDSSAKRTKRQNRSDEVGTGFLG
jgi:hypothetical protein